MSDPQRLEVNLVSWGSHIWKIDGERWIGITAIGWDDELQRTPGYGMTRSHAPIGRTAGKYVPPTVKVTLHRHTWALLLAYLRDRAPDGRSYTKTEFHQLLQLSEGDLNSDLEFLRCTVTKRSGKAEENPDPNMVDIELSTMGAKEDGATMWDSSEDVA